MSLLYNKAPLIENTIVFYNIHQLFIIRICIMDGQIILNWCTVVRNFMARRNDALVNSKGINVIQFTFPFA